MKSVISNNFNLITLSGMMGSGKTSCGSILAKKLGVSFIDIDSIIELEEKLEINQIFDQFGERYFRSIEEKLTLLKVNECLKQNIKAIISLGGGGFESKKTREFLLNNSTVIWLNSDIKILSNQKYTFKINREYSV